MRPPDSKSPSLASVRRGSKLDQTQNFRAQRVTKLGSGGRVSYWGRGLVVLCELWDGLVPPPATFFSYGHLRDPEDPEWLRSGFGTRRRFVRSFLTLGYECHLRARSLFLSLLPSFGDGGGSLQYIQGKPMAELKTGAGTWFRVRRDAASREVECARYSHVRPLNGIIIAYFSCSLIFSVSRTVSLLLSLRPISPRLVLSARLVAVRFDCGGVEPPRHHAVVSSPS